VKKEEVLGILQDNGFVLDEEKAIPYGVQFSFRNGAKVNVYDKGTVTPQGQHIEQVKVLLGLAAPSAAPAQAVTHQNSLGRCSELEDFSLGDRPQYRSTPSEGNNY
jgi:hypothetical protein